MSSYEETAATQPKVATCRHQLSAFDPKFTYLAYKASILSNPFMQPLSVFTLCNVSSNGYGMFIDYSTCLISIFFKMTGKWIIHKEAITMDSIKGLKELTSSNIDICKIVDSLENQFDTGNSIDILSFLANQKGLSSFAQSTSSHISYANNAIEKML